MPVLRGTSSPSKKKGSAVPTAKPASPAFSLHFGSRFLFVAGFLTVAGLGVGALQDPVWVQEFIRVSHWIFTSPRAALWPLLETFGFLGVAALWLTCLGLTLPRRLFFPIAFLFAASLAFVEESRVVFGRGWLGGVLARGEWRPEIVAWGAVVISASLAIMSLARTTLFLAWRPSRLARLQEAQRFSDAAALEEHGRRLRRSSLAVVLAIPGIFAFVPVGSRTVLPQFPATIDIPSHLYFVIDADMCKRDVATNNTSACLDDLLPSELPRVHRKVWVNSLWSADVWLEMLLGRNRFFLGLASGETRYLQNILSSQRFQVFREHGYRLAAFSTHGSVAGFSVETSQEQESSRVNREVATRDGLHIIFPTITLLGDLISFTRSDENEVVRSGAAGEIHRAVVTFLNRAHKLNQPVVLGFHLPTAGGVRSQAVFVRFIRSLARTGWLHGARTSIVMLPGARDPATCEDFEPKDLAQCIRERHQADLWLMGEAIEQLPESLVKISDLVSVDQPDNSAITKPVFLEEAVMGDSQPPIRIWWEHPCGFMTISSHDGRRVVPFPIDGSSINSCSINDTQLFAFEHFLDQGGASVIRTPAGRVFYRENLLP